jgi:hypothetical protein
VTPEITPAEPDPDNAGEGNQALSETSELPVPNRLDAGAAVTVEEGSIQSIDSIDSIDAKVSIISIKKKLRR